MSKNVYACKPDDDVAEAEAVMSVRQVRRLPVIGDDGTPIGMLSVTDVVQQVKPASRFQKAGNAPDECLRTIAAISEPRSKLQTTPSQRELSGRRRRLPMCSTDRTRAEDAAESRTANTVAALVEHVERD